MENKKRLIDAMRLIIKLAKKVRFGRLEYDDVLAVIADAPTVDAVEVVPCKDCVHRKERVCCNPSAGMWIGVELKDSDFCSYGERREGEQRWMNTP